MKKPQTGWWSLSRIFVLALAFCFVGIAPQGYISTVEAAKKKKKRRTKIKFRKGGHLFVATDAFPTSAEDLKGFIKIGKKHNKNRFRVDKGSDLTLQILIVLKRQYKTSGINYVLYQKGKKEHVSFQAENVPKGKVQLHISRLVLNGSVLKTGKKYELRVTTVRKRGRTFHVTVLARTSFRIR